MKSFKSTSAWYSDLHPIYSAMAAVLPGSLVLISGINGHVASSIALRLLEKGYQVRGTVRSLKSARFVKDALSQYGDKLEIVQVPDIAKPSAFEGALKGMYYNI